MNSVTSELFVVVFIFVLTAARLAYVRTRPVLRDVHDAQLPYSRRLRAGDFFRRPRSQDVKDSFHVLPYGTLWFGINLPLMHLTGFGERRWSYSLALIDMLFIWVSLQFGIAAGIIYIVLGTFQLLKAPWNVCINWLTISGIFSWIFLILAPATKLPIGIPMRQRKRVQGLLFHQHNYIYYSLLGALWLFVFWRTIIPWFLAGTWFGQVVGFTL